VQTIIHNGADPSQICLKYFRVPATAMNGEMAHLTDLKSRDRPVNWRKLPVLGSFEIDHGRGTPASRSLETCRTCIMHYAVADPSAAQMLHPGFFTASAISIRHPKFSPPNRCEAVASNSGAPLLLDAAGFI
jgi:hypothetical protein